VYTGSTMRSRLYSPSQAGTPDGGGCSRSRMVTLVLGQLFLLAQACSAFIILTNGYFWDPDEQSYWIPHGIAYQTINSAVFATQSPAQIEYDMLEMKKIHANSLRVDFTWGEIETNDNQFNWSPVDHIVQTAEDLGLRLFALIGYQYPPAWFPTGWLAVKQNGEQSNIINYEHPDARSAYTDFISRVTSRYKDSPAIAAWILGNEYAYFDLWETNDPHLFVGYDSISQAAFRNWLSNYYSGSIAALNSNWGTAYSSFDEVVMATNYPADRHDPGYHDLIQWRKQSIGHFVALGAVAARNADTNHLISYSMVGGIYNGFDANNTCEDAETIVECCQAAGAPLDFWSINNYAWALEGSELRSAQFGITKYQDQSGLPVLVTETGHSSTEHLFPGASNRYDKALPGQLWEALIAGAIGVHVFTWNDRPMPQTRERGFGIVGTNRVVKSVYWNVLESYRRMEQINIDRLLGGSSNPPNDILFYWGQDADMGWPRANQENCMLWGGLKRLGYEPGFIDEEAFDAGAYTTAQALVLSRAYQLAPERLDAVYSNVIAQGVHVYANGDLPGRFNAYHWSNSNWAARMSDIFGLNVIGCTDAWHGGVSGWWDQPYTRVDVRYVGSLGPLTNGYPWTNLVTWRVWNGIRASSGTTIVQRIPHNLGTDTNPALHIKGHASGAKAAINTFTLGDNPVMWWLPGDPPDQMSWQEHWDYCHAVFRDWFGLPPHIDISSTGYAYVIPDYRICSNGSVLISLLNESTNPITFTVTASNLLYGRTVEQLSPPAGVLETNSDGQLTFTFSPDEYRLLYAYYPGESLANTSRYKVWLANEPIGIWPNGWGYEVQVGCDTRGETLDVHLAFEGAAAPFVRYGETSLASVVGVVTNTLRVPVPDADLHDDDYRSSPDGGSYRLHAWLEKNGTNLSECFLDTRLCWGVRPASLPAGVRTGQTYDITVLWQELPSYESWEIPTPLSRADLWEPELADYEWFRLTLELMTGGVTVASTSWFTSTGTSSNLCSITVPPDSGGSVYDWFACAMTFPGGPRDLVDSFEDRPRGDTGTEISPWESFSYAENHQPTVWAHGVHGLASHGTNSAFMAVENYTNAGSWSGFGMAREWYAPWSLPADTNEWTNIVAAFDFRETNGYTGTLELKLEDADGDAIHYLKTYTNPGGWDTISNNLAAFYGESYLGDFDSTRVKKLVINFQMGQTGVTYLGCFDYILFQGADQYVSGTVYAVYYSDNDTLYDTDGDGVYDRYETWSGIFRSETNTGTDPYTPDTDGDGHSDGEELTTGFDPNAATSYFHACSVQSRPAGSVVLEWEARTGRLYWVEYHDQSLSNDAAFVGHPTLTDITVAADGIVTVTDQTAASVSLRFYRIGTRRQP